MGRWQEMPHAGAPREHALRREFAGLPYTRLLHRWNLPHAQANLWLLGAAGTARAQEHEGRDGMGAASFLADYETTRVYTASRLGFTAFRCCFWRWVPGSPSSRPGLPGRARAAEDSEASAAFRLVQAKAPPEGGVFA